MVVMYSLNLLFAVVIYERPHKFDECFQFEFLHGFPMPKVTNTNCGFMESTFYFSVDVDQYELTLYLPIVIFAKYNS